MTFVELHSVWDADHPDDAAYRRVTHPGSEFPCPGKLIVEDTSDPAPSIVCCTVCGWCTTARLTTRKPAASAAPF